MEENTQERIEMPIFDDNDTDKLNDDEKNLDKKLDINKFEEIKIKKKGIFKEFKDYHPYIRALLFLIIFFLLHVILLGKATIIIEIGKTFIIPY